MKITRIIPALLIALALPASALAASVSTAPTTVSVSPGQTFSVALTANPAGAKTYTYSAHVSFDPKLVQFVGWSFSSKWVVLSQAGYDLEDNTNGSLIKTAGYPGGITSATTLGTATFRAVAAGTASINVTGASLALDGSGKNQLSGTQGATSVAIAPVAPAPKPAKTTPAPAPSATQPSATTSSTSTSSTATTSLMTATSGAAAVAAAGISPWWWVLLLVVALVLVGGYVYLRKPSPPEPPMPPMQQ